MDAWYGVGICCAKCGGRCLLMCWHLRPEPEQRLQHAHNKADNHPSRDKQHAAGARTNFIVKMEPRNGREGRVLTRTMKKLGKTDALTKPASLT